MDQATDGAGRRYRVAGLTNDETYEIQVRAVNPVGEGPWSETATATPAFGVAVSPTNVAVNECASSEYQVVLRSRPTSNVKIDMALQTGGALTIDPATLTFTRANWSTEQSVRLSAACDNVLGGYTGTVTHTVDDARSADEYDGLDIDSVVVTVGDDDRLLPPGNLRATPGDSEFTASWDLPAYRPQSYELRYSTSPQFTSPNVLSYQPHETSGTITGLTNGRTYYVKIRSYQLRGSIQYYSDYSPTIRVTPRASPSLPGKPSPPAVAALDRALNVTWTAPQRDGGNTITSYDLRHRQVPGPGETQAWTEVNPVWRLGDGTLEHEIGELTNGTQYEVEVRAVTSVGNGPWSDAALGTPAEPEVSITADAASVTEGEEATFTVAAGAAPTKAIDVTVTVTAGGDYGVTTGDRMVTIAAGTASAQLTVTTSDDLLAEAAGTITATLGAGTDYTVAAAPDDTDTVSVTDDDRLPGVPRDLEAEPGHQAVDLTWMAPLDDGTSDLDHYELEYSTAADFSASPQRVTTDSNTTSSHSITGLTNGTAYYFRLRGASAAGAGPWAVTSATPRTVPGTPTLDGAVPGDGRVTVSWTAPSEDGGAAITSYTVEYADLSDVTTPLTIPTTSGTATSLVVAPLTNGQKYQFRVRAVNAAGDGAWSNSLQATPTKPLGATVTVDDPFKVTEGDSATYTVKLISDPTAEVVIDVVAPAGSGVTVDTDSLTFTTLNWSVEQTVTVTAAHDEDAVDETVVITHAVDTDLTADGYDAIDIDSVTVKVDDDDPGVTVSPTALGIDEGGSGTYTVRLAAEPASDVVIRATAPTGSDVAVDTDGDMAGDQSLLTFTSDNWNTAQTVTVKASEDTDGTNDTALIVHAVVAASSADEYDTVTVSGVTVTVDDNDPGLVFFPTALTVNEGGTGAYTVRLTVKPSSDVTIDVAADAGLTVDTDEGKDGDQDTLTFTDLDWDSPQTVTVTTAHDDDAVDDLLHVTHSVDDGKTAFEYRDVADLMLGVTVSDDDTAAIVIAPTMLTVDEGGTGTYEVELAVAPTGSVTVDVTAGAGLTVDTDDGTEGDQGTLTFTTSNWSAGQTVTVTAAEDDDVVETAAQVTHSVDDDQSPAEYDDAADVTLGVTVRDDDTASIVVTPTPLTVREGASKDYTVKLGAEPTGSVTVDVTAGAGLTVDADGGTDGDQGTLTFTVSDWSTGQTVTVTAADDEDAVDGAAEIVHRVEDDESPTDFDGVTAALPVTVTDDDTASIVVTPTPLTVREGSSKDYTVKLGAAPTGSVTIEVTTPAGLTVDTDDQEIGDQDTLPFTQSDWSTPQTVRLTAHHDPDGDDATLEVAHSVDDDTSPADYDGVTAALSVEVSDDDTPAIVVTAAENFAVVEGATATYTVELTTQPGGDVVIQLTATGAGVSVDTDRGMAGDQDRLTFTTTDWNTARTVTVGAAEDDDVDAGSATVTHAVVDAESDEDYDPVPDVTLAVAVSDDDTAAIVVTAAADFTVDEGGLATYSVKLATEPGSDVVVQLSLSAGSGVTVDQSRLTFTASDWSTAQSVTVSAGQDDDGDAGSTTITHAVVDAESDEDYDDVPDVSLSVAVSDDDTPGIVVTAAENFGVTEGGTNTYTVKLATKPGSDVVVQLSVSAGSGVSVDTDSEIAGAQSVLTFTSTDWNTARIVTVGAAEDDDGDAGSATITHAVVDAESDEDYDPVPDVTLAVAVTDDDVAAIVVTAAENFTVVEGATATYTVELATQPGGDVVIQLTATGAGVSVDTDTGMSGDQDRLTFTTTDWNTARTVTVAAAHDDDVDAGSATVTHAVVDAESDEDYDPVPDVTLAVAVTDDDVAAIVVEAAENFGVIEGSTASYSVRLATQPGGDVVIRLSASGSGVTVDTDSEMAGDQTTLTFTSTDWNTEQTVTVAAAHDDDGDPGSATITHAVVDAESDEDYDAADDVILDVAVTDDDIADIVVTAVENFMVAEGSTATYTVKLATKPGSDVVVQLSVAGAGVTVDTDSGVTGDQSRLTFTTSDWSTAQTVIVAASHDDDGDPGSATITHTVVDAESDDDYDPVPDVALAVAVTDDDVAAIVVEAAENFGVAEGSTATYTVELATQPGGDVVIQLTATGVGVSVDTDTGMSGDQSRLTFTTTDWSTAQTVIVAASHDDDGDAGSATVTHAVVDAESDDDYDPVPDVALAVAVTDDDVAAIVVEAAENFTVVEGSTATYTVRLDTQPGGDVVVQLSVAGAGVTVDTDSGMSGDQSRLTFTSTDWNTPRTVTVAAAHDDDGDAGSATVTHAVVDAESDDDYDPAPDVTLAVAVSDDDTPGIVVTAAENFTVGEGSTATYTVRLATQPGGDVVIRLSASGAGVTVDTDAGMTGDQSRLTFSTSDWSTAQSVTVSAAEDDDGDAGSATITHAVVDAESDEDYDPVPDVTLAVAVTDNDVAAIVVSAAENFTVVEGSTATYTVKLATKPGSDVVVQLSVTAGAGVTVDTDSGMTGDQSRLTFTTSDWSTAQSVTVAAAHDDDGDPGSATITHTVVDAESDEDYDPVPDVALAVAVTDDDEAAIVVSAAENFTVVEGSTGTYAVRLATEPGGDVVVELSVSAGVGVSVDTDAAMTGTQTKLTFTTSNWSTAQTVIVAAAHDDDGDSGSAAITHAVVDAESDEDYEGTDDVTLAVAVSDDDIPAIVVTAAENFGVTEGSTASYSVRLATQPGGDVVVQLGVAGAGVSVDTDSGMSGDQSRLTFTASDWSTVQTVTVAASHDDDW